VCVYAHMFKTHHYLINYKILLKYDRGLCLLPFVSVDAWQ
jgi:hypothetical protein